MTSQIFWIIDLNTLCGYMYTKVKVCSEFFVHVTVILLAVHGTC